jgi:hypothetical protein
VIDHLQTRRNGGCEAGERRLTIHHCWELLEGRRSCHGESGAQRGPHVKPLTVAASRGSLATAAWGWLDVDGGVRSAYLWLQDILKVAYRASLFLKTASNYCANAEGIFVT